MRPEKHHTLSKAQFVANKEEPERKTMDENENFYWPEHDAENFVLNLKSKKKSR